MDIEELENSVIAPGNNKNEIDHLIDDSKKAYRELHGVSTLLTPIASTSYWLVMLLVSGATLLFDDGERPPTPLLSDRLWILLPFLIVLPVIYINMVSRYFLEMSALSQEVKKVIKVILSIAFAGLSVAIWYFPSF